MQQSDFWTGMRGGLPVMLSAVPFGGLFGALAVQNGMSVTDAALMSALCFAGASQMVGIELFGKNVEPWLIVLSIFAVNFRHILYSASIAPHLNHFTWPQKLIAFNLLTDPQYAEAERRAERGIPVTFSWYMGFGLVIYVPWLLVTIVGALFGRFIGDPRMIGLDVLLPVYFFGMLMSFRSRDHWLPIVLVSSVVSVAAYRIVGSPWHVSFGALSGVLLAAFLPVAPKGEATR
ncbi:AzlC family ABC transporter permease [Ensifer soli]|uniref:AzlC family ABC transporter permease n=1 Tax=Ciceribacter sp. sgz301302 TaxID=3342379 RepID=UPI0035B78566